MKAIMHNGEIGEEIRPIAVYSVEGSPSVWIAKDNLDKEVWLRIPSTAITLLFNTSDSDVPWKEISELEKISFVPTEEDEGILILPLDLTLPIGFEIEGKFLNLLLKFDASLASAIATAFLNVPPKQILSNMLSKIKIILSKPLTETNVVAEFSPGDNIPATKIPGVDLKFSLMGLKLKQIKLLEEDVNGLIQPDGKDFLTRIEQQRTEAIKIEKPIFSQSQSMKKPVVKDEPSMEASSDKETTAGSTTQRERKVTSPPSAPPSPAKQQASPPPSVGSPPPPPPSSSKKAVSPMPPPSVGAPPPPSATITSPLSEVPSAPKPASPIPASPKPKNASKKTSPPSRRKKGRPKEAKQPEFSLMDDEDLHSIIEELEEEDKLSTSSQSVEEGQFFPEDIEERDYKPLSEKGLKIDWYDRMILQRTYPITVKISEQKLEKKKSVTSLVSGERISEVVETIEVEEEKPIIIRPQFPGSLVVPAERIVLPEEKETTVQFFVTPLSKGWMEAHIEFVQSEKIVEDIKLRSKVIDHRLAKIAAISGSIVSAVPATFAFLFNVSLSDFFEERIQGIDGSLMVLIQLILTFLLFGSGFGLYQWSNFRSHQHKTFTG